ncbi:MAG: transketolase [Candidatus Yonathbacteria bacterium CG_4_10_14_3_um_filter_47_65]|uniref:Transketolase n=2 Tax=Parcubacteria group TaxID=1794811 RepID=A0A2M8D964_9BACT|nr:MAG: transketolase [Candidatus Nomurabacteria bacterium CG1_02_47_685]PIP03906.1 MAG: transketolase [Candidatus Yonathbacteria bacterium CG23_combo_of_CG06-09_8_20_14_all_46_18]PIQ31186.1 MAG: transketolase [Candidatus Yonathbacteria bacterium CG17_big_fil_post_rev_8_21_14_2_50_46_19]PIX56402.1 MAG: transketolase [Candidatus Yonathbacteria bacterium CG_4_10_14_3_um_filter_47_65]PIY58023.1 MAG: transketolase [Candidatus Yonathbacteria bacterium CG_4_10_14_0_8_um_filter_47_645]PJB83673.1 MAG:
MPHLDDKKVAYLEHKANEIRQSIIEMLLAAGSGHTAGPLGMADVFAAFYFHILNHRPSEPFWEGRDRLILSNGHICPVLYAAMAHAGYFPVKELKTLRKFGSRLQGHPHREFLPGIETSSGPLGSGLSQAIGMALADRMDHGTASNKFFYCFMGDGELDCGQVWEAFMLAGKERLHNLIAVIDRNNIQIDGFTEDIMPLEPLKEKFESFNWHVIEINGHSFEEINDAVEQAKSVFSLPSVIIAHTIPGKGVLFAERRFEWHGAPPGQGPEDVVPKKDQGKEALAELRSLGGKISGEHE